jgi:threonine dehydratase
VVGTRLDGGRVGAARAVIDPVFLDTPMYPCDALGRALGCTVSIKLETANPVRSFKGRGTELVASMLAGQGRTDVVCASAGNLGQALAWSAGRRGIHVTVVASRWAPVAKLDRIRALGAALELVDGDFEAARERATSIAQRDGVRLVEDSRDLETCEGAATIGLELAAGAAQAGAAQAGAAQAGAAQAGAAQAGAAQAGAAQAGAAQFDTVLIALGGGAMATGVGHVLKTHAPAAEVICVQPSGAPAMTLSWRARRVVTTDSADTIADGVAGRYPIPAVLDDLLVVADDAVLVQEASIVAGLRLLLEHAGLVVEPSAALGVAAVLEDRERFAGRHVVVIICGSNVDLDAYRRWIS